MAPLIQTIIAVFIAMEWVNRLRKRLRKVRPESPCLGKVVPWVILMPMGFRICLLGDMALIFS